MPKMQKKTSQQNIRIIKNPFYRNLIKVCGWMSVILGIIGIFLPLLPTTPFLLLAAYCFLRTTPKAYRWLVKHPRFGKYITHYLEGRGIPLKTKIYSVIAMVTTISISAYLFIPDPVMRLTLVITMLLIGIYIFQLPTLSIKKEEEKENK